MHYGIRFLLLFFSVWFAAPERHSHATDLTAPTGAVVLTISGAIEVGNNAGSAEFDLALLESLPTATLETTTPWTEGLQVFRGVLMRDLLQAVQASGTAVKATALNDYFVEIPIEDFAADPVLLATRRNGETMTVRNKGPLWIIYPSDSSNPRAQERMVWQLSKLEILP